MIESYFKIEGLLSDYDMNIPLSRDTFEKLNQDLFERLKALVRSALDMAELSVNQIYGIELVGGISRIPIIQQIFKNLLNK